MKIKVIPSNRPTMFLFFSTIYVTPEYLTVTSDRCLHAAICHELGHQKQFKVMLAITLITMAIFIQLFILFPGFIFFSPLVYLWFCYLCRLGEFKADEYSLRETDKESMREMLAVEGSRMDHWLVDNTWLYLFRWHPSSDRRLKNLEQILPFKTSNE